MIEKFKSVNWVQFLAQIIGMAIAVAGVIWILAESKGDNRWANKDKTETHITQIREALVKNTAHDETSHGQLKLFAPKEDVLRLENQVQEVRKEQLQFWSEQRSVNREILERLPR